MTLGAGDEDEADDTLAVEEIFEDGALPVEEDEAADSDETVLASDEDGGSDNADEPVESIDEDEDK